MNRIKEEQRVVEQMICLYCRKMEGNKELCPSCKELLQYASKRIRDASRYTSKKISLKLLFLSDIFLFPFVRQQFPVLA